MANYSDAPPMDPNTVRTASNTMSPATTTTVHSGTHSHAHAHASPAEDMRTIAMNRISWGAVLAGVVTALVIQLLLNILGAGIGMGTLDVMRTENNPETSTASLVAAAWWTLTGIIASYVGGTVAGRLAGAPDRSTAGWHGFVAWAATTLIIFYLLTTSLSSLVGGTLNRLGSFGQAAGQAAANVAPGLGQVADPFAAIEQELRSQTGGNVDTGAARDAVVAAVRSAFTGNQAERQQATNRAVDAYAQAANIPPDEARRRVGALQQRYDQAAQQARQAADATKQVVSQAAIFGVGALALGALAAWFGGASGRPRRETGHLNRADRMS